MSTSEPPAGPPPASDSTPRLPAPERPWFQRFQALVEVALASGVVSSILAGLPLAMQSEIPIPQLLKEARWIAAFVLWEASITLLIIALLLRAHNQGPGVLGLRWDRWRGDLLWGAALVPVLFGLNIVVSVFFQVFLPEHFLERNPLLDAIRSPEDLRLFLLSILYAGGIKEEVQRAFILNRFERHLGGVTVGLILWSVIFGAGHYLQGPQGIVAAGIYGLLFGILYLARRSLLAPIIAHSLYDLLAVLGYWQWGRGA